MKNKRPPWTVSTGRKFNGLPVLGSWEYTYLRTWPGACTSHAWSEKPQYASFFLSTLRPNRLPQKLLINFYRFTTESILIYCCKVSYSRCTTASRKDLQLIVKMAQWIVGYPLPDLRDIHSSCLHKQASNIMRDPSLSVHHPPLRTAQNHMHTDQHAEK